MTIFVPGAVISVKFEIENFEDENNILFVALDKMKK